MSANAQETILIKKNEPAQFSGFLVPHETMQDLSRSSDELEVYKQKIGNLELTCIRKEECPDSFFSPLTAFLLGVVAGGIGAFIATSRH